MQDGLNNITASSVSKEIKMAKETSVAMLLATIQQVKKTGTSDSVLRALSESFTKASVGTIVVNGGIVPAAAKSFKDANIPLQSIRDSVEGLVQVYFELNGNKVIVYETPVYLGLVKERLLANANTSGTILSFIIRFIANRLM